MGFYITTPQLKYRLARYVNPYWATDGRPKYAGFTDSQYYAPSRNELEQFLRDTPLQRVGNFGEVFDCDDYTYVMKGAASLYARDFAKISFGLCIGIAWGNFSWKPDPFHACNWAVTDDGMLQWIEPQNHSLHVLNACRGDLTLILI